jgi:hypothetical protein
LVSATTSSSAIVDVLTGVADVETGLVETEVAVEVGFWQPVRVKEAKARKDKTIFVFLIFRFLR